MIVLGVDQSYNSSGIVILNGDSNIIHCECFKSNKEFNRFGQAHEVAMHVAGLLDKYQPDVVALEGLAFGMRGNVTRDLGGLQFVIIAHLQEVKKQPVDIIAPLTVKKFATGSGRAKKNEMIESLPKQVHDKFTALGVKKTTGLADLADAYWIAKLALSNNKKEVK